MFFKSYHTIISIIQTDSLLGKSVRSGGILTIATMVESASRFLRNIILARLLAPEAFGLMATVMASAAVIEAFAEIGLKQSVIQNKYGADEDFLNMTFWISGIRGALIYLIAFSMAPLIGEFFNKPESLTFLRVGFLGILFNGLVSPRIHVLEKELKFKKWIMLTQGAAVAGIIFTIALALIYKNPWALVIGYVSEEFLKTFFSHLILSFKPKLKFHTIYSRHIFQYSKGMFGLPILMMVFAQADIFTIGRLLPMEVLGIYFLIKGLAEMPNSLVSRIVSPVVLPVFSMIKDDKEKLSEALLKTTEAVGIFLISFIGIITIFAREILSLVYGSPYTEGAISFRILCIMNLILTFSGLIMVLYMSLGRPDIHRNAVLARTFVLLILIYPATKYLGLMGAAGSVLLGMITSWSIQVIYMKRLMNIKTVRYYKAFETGIRQSALVIIPALLLKIMFNLGDQLGVGVAIFLCLVALGLTLRRVSVLMKEIGLKQNP